MFTSLEIDEDLFREAWGLSSSKSKKGAFEEALRTFVRLHEQAGVRALRGKLIWKGDLAELREERGANRR